MNCPYCGKLVPKNILNREPGTCMVWPCYWKSLDKKTKDKS